MQRRPEDLLRSNTLFQGSCLGDRAAARICAYLFFRIAQHSLVSSERGREVLGVALELPSHLRKLRREHFLQRRAVLQKPLCRHAPAAEDTKGGAGALAGSGQKRQRGPHREAGSKEGHEPSSKQVDVCCGWLDLVDGPWGDVSNGGARRWTADGVALRVDGGGNGKIRRMGSGTAL